MNEVKKNLETVSIIVSIAVVIISIVIGTTYYNVNDRKLMSANIDSAIAKGIDPISVRCLFPPPTQLPSTLKIFRIGNRLIF